MREQSLPIRVQGLSLTKGERRLLDDINLTIREPGISMIMGPNGAGKSLLLRCIHGLISPDSGTIHLANRPLAERRQSQAMVFQHPVLLRRTALQNLEFAAPDLAAQDPAALLVALEKVNLGARAHQPARMLSGGEQQRLALARALLRKPGLLLLDEATASLDPASVYLIESLVKQQNLLGTKVVFVSHDQGQARRLADEVIFLCHGRVVEQRSARGFFSAPGSDEAKAYLAGKIMI
ncbi:ATP-binding cassette domain-containing protein [Litorivicinus lipolyticus]|uniref:ATP-binding cassette domain-containing protein n=1 Tax=Litorivicinus lipolyticus TaxID=418701 RepID=A0A5Q2QAM0_9GAMM|nr:ATP-binding cassette domain-containing protein [Litorivicinus lipolyticus]QGG79282.1 ATP-binding cassette domain-containing protein [Litorivicinus lipolyticus]